MRLKKNRTMLNFSEENLQTVRDIVNDEHLYGYPVKKYNFLQLRTMLLGNGYDYAWNLNTMFSRYSDQHPVHFMTDWLHSFELSGRLYNILNSHYMLLKNVQKNYVITYKRRSTKRFTETSKHLQKKSLMTEYGDWLFEDTDDFTTEEFQRIQKYEHMFKEVIIVLGCANKVNKLRKKGKFIPIHKLEDYNYIGKTICEYYNDTYDCKAKYECHEWFAPDIFPVWSKQNFRIALQRCVFRLIYPNIIRDNSGNIEYILIGFDDYPFKGKE
jgi:hypothetical protein